MGKRTFSDCERSRGAFAVMLVAVLLAFALLFTAPAEAEENGTEVDAARAAAQDAKDKARDLTGELRKFQVNDTSGAAQDTDPIDGHTANIDSTDGDDIANTVSIAIADCTAAADATVVVEDKDDPPTRVTLTNGGNVDITTSAQEITIEGKDGGNITGGNPTGGNKKLNTQPTGSTAQGTVISSTGITCGNGSGTNNTDNTSAAENADSGDNDTAAAGAGVVTLSCEQLTQLVTDSASGDQYVTEMAQKCEVSANVITGTIPDRQLSDTGGISPPALMLALGAVLSGGGLLIRSTLRRGE